jgi:hypothetical protein
LIRSTLFVKERNKFQPLLKMKEGHLHPASGLFRLALLKIKKAFPNFGMARNQQRIKEK